MAKEDEIKDSPLPDDICCRDLAWCISKGSFEKVGKKILTREGNQVIKYCPFCGEEV